MKIDGNWKRKAFVTRGADPTEVVEWSNRVYSIQEFQNVYMVYTVMGGHSCDDMRKAGEWTHKRLEQRFDRQQNGRR